MGMATLIRYHVGDSLYTDGRIRADTARQAQGRPGARARPSGAEGSEEPG